MIHRPIFYLTDGKHYELKSKVSKETVKQYMKAADIAFSVEQSYVLNLDHIRMLESKKAYNGKSYKYEALMVNGKTINISQKSFPKIKEELVKNSVQSVSEAQ